MLREPEGERLVCSIRLSSIISTARQAGQRPSGPWREKFKRFAVRSSNQPTVIIDRRSMTFGSSPVGRPRCPL